MILLLENRRVAGNCAELGIRSTLHSWQPDHVLHEAVSAKQAGEV